MSDFEVPRITGIWVMNGERLAVSGDKFNRTRIARILRIII